MRPFSMTTVAWMSPWREVPQPEYVPSLYTGAVGWLIAGSGVGDNVGVAAGVGVDVGSGLAVASGLDSGASAGAFLIRGSGLAGLAAEAGVAGATEAADGGAIGAGPGATAPWLSRASWGITTRARSAAASLAAAGAVRKYPAAYTASTAADPSAIR